MIITGIATAILAMPEIKSWCKYRRKLKWQKEIKSRVGETEDDKKIGYIAEKAVEYFDPRYVTYEVCGRISFVAENESREVEGKEPLNSNGDILSIRFRYFERFVKELLKEYDEEPFIEALFYSSDLELLGYFKEPMIHYCFSFKTNGGERFVDLYTEPIIVGPADTMRGCYI